MRARKGEDCRVQEIIWFMQARILLTAECRISVCCDANWRSCGEVRPQLFVERRCMQRDSILFEICIAESVKRMGGVVRRLESGGEYVEG